MKKEKRFKNGDHITYKSIEHCHGGYYFYGGRDMGGYVGRIIEYHSFNKEGGSYEISVTNIHGNYSMLESEFEEYDNPKTQELFPIF
jgi:hypothetical protein